MTTLITPEELVRYMYQETSPEQTELIERALNEDWTLREKLEVLKASASSLDQNLVSPRMESVVNVLRYARETAVANV
ncbi:MAG: hypothetical protein K2P88_17445 [Chitinophagaceae bacterium]|nr:hypothetical protein [Chitinophagaceae bacterium]